MLAHHARSSEAGPRLSVFAMTLCWVVVHLAGAVSPALGQRPLTQEDIWRLASEQQNKIQSVKVQYRKVTYAVDGVPGKPPLPREARWPALIEYVLWRDQRFHRTVLQQIDDEPPPRTHIYLYRGGKNYSFSQAQNVLTVTAEKDPGLDIDIYCTEMLQLVFSDYDLANLDNLWTYPHCIRRLEPAIYALSAQREDVDGHACLVLEAPRGDKLWIDPEIGCRLRKRERWEIIDGEKALIARWQCGAYREVKDGIWAPYKCGREVFASRVLPKEHWNKLVETLELEVGSLAFNEATDADFDFVLPPGIVYSDDGVSFRSISGNKEAALSEFVKSIPPPFFRGRWWFFAVNVAVVALIVLVAIRVLFRKASQKKTGDAQS